MKNGNALAAAEELHRSGSAAQEARDYKAATQYWSKALKLYKIAGEGGNVEAQLIAGIMCENARGAPADYTESSRWFRMAAEQGNDEAQYMLGLNYFTGQGVTQDFVRAYVWLTLAASTGYDRPNDFLPLVLKRMTREQVSEAKVLVERWKPKPWKPRKRVAR